MTLTTAAIIYYVIATPLLFLTCKMMYVGGKDRHTTHVPTYKEAVTNAHNRLTASDCHTMNDVGIDGTANDLKHMLSTKK